MTRSSSQSHPNPIQLDDRTGSGDLAPLLSSFSVPTRLCRLEFGDAAFIGNGPDGMPIPVGIEIKQLSDVLKCITDGRFAGHQLPGLVGAYDYVWLIVEGPQREDETSGMLQTYTRRGWTNASVGSRQFTYREYTHWVLTMSIKAGVRYIQTYNRRATAGAVVNLYRWWTAKTWEDHRSHLTVHNHMPDQALLTRPSLVRMLAKELPGIGWEKAAAVARHFRTPLEMAVAEVEDWMQIDGVGAKLAAAAVRAFNTGKTTSESSR